MYYEGSIHIEEADQCFSCAYFNKGVACPLLEALALGVVNLNTEVVVTNCGFYKPFKRSLRVIGGALNTTVEESPPNKPSAASSFPGRVKDERAEPLP